MSECAVPHAARTCAQRVAYKGHCTDAKRTEAHVENTTGHTGNTQQQRQKHTSHIPNMLHRSAMGCVRARTCAPGQHGIQRRCVTRNCGLTCVSACVCVRACMCVCVSHPYRLKAIDAAATDVSGSGKRPLSIVMSVKPRPSAVNTHTHTHTGTHVSCLPN